MTPTSPLWVGIEVTARPAADGDASALGLLTGDGALATGLVALEGLLWGVVEAV